MRYAHPLLVILALSTPAFGAPPAFRTDGGDDKLPWFQLKPGEFPPEGSAHHISGELIGLDHVNRTGTLRPDRDDTQRRGEWDIPKPFVMLPFGSIRYHGAPAELKDVPIGTHLHGQFYADEIPAVVGKPRGKPVTVPATFSRVLLLEDDFSYNSRQGRTWRVDSVQPEANTVTVTGVGPEGKADAKSINFPIRPSTRVWKGRGFGTLADLAAGQTVQLNITANTLKGPGRCTDIWLDPESRELASARQVEVHRQFQREHGLAGWVEEVDNKQGIVTVALFAGFDPKLLENFNVNEPVAAAVAIESLRTYDQINDVKRGPIVKVERGPAGPGNSGVRIHFKPSLLLEGYRPQRIVRLFAGSLRVDDLPREERFYP